MKSIIPLIGSELRVAAIKKLPVRYIERYYDPSQPWYDETVIMEKANVGYYIGPSDIDPNEFGDDDRVAGEFPEGNFEVCHVSGVKYE